MKFKIVISIFITLVLLIVGFVSVFSAFPLHPSLLLPMLFALACISIGLLFYREIKDKRISIGTLLLTISILASLFWLLAGIRL